MISENQADMLERLRAEHPGWIITANPGGLNVWTAERASKDRRSIRYIVAGSAAELAGKLAAELAEQ